MRRSPPFHHREFALHRARCRSLLLAGVRPPPIDATSPREQVFAAERAFAASMAGRDLTAFASFVDEEAIFFSSSGTLRGRQSVVDAWSRFFADKEAPFSWEPDEVEVLPSGTLAFSSGPVRAPDGTVVARFNSVWRLHSSGEWKVVFDKGSPLPAKPDGQ